MQGVFALLLGVLCGSPVEAGTVQSPLLLRLFLTEGGTLLSFGEYTRTPDLVVFAMPVGGPIAEPQVQVVSLPAAAIDWPRTEGYASSARYHHYASTRGEQEFQQLTEDVARTLNRIASTTEPAQALQLAGAARLALLRWPGDHYSYRAADVEEIVWLLDESIGALRAKLGVGAFDVELSTHTASLPPGPPPGDLTPLDVLNGIVAGARITPRAADRMVLLQAALHYLDESGGALPAREATAIRQKLRTTMQAEQQLDARYAKWSAGLLRRAGEAAARGKAGEAQAIATLVIEEDRKLGQARPEVVGALLAAVQQKAADASAFRLQRDRRQMNRDLYAQYQRAVGPMLSQIERLQPVLDAIRRQEGPAPSVLSRWLNTLAGGARLLEEQRAPDGISGSHGMLVGAWHLAEQALRSRQSAVASGSTTLSSEAASAASGALLLIQSAQREHRAFVDGQPSK